MASDISAYNVQQYIHKLEKLSKYEYPFERLKHIENQYKPDPEEEEKKDGDDSNKLEEIKEVNEDQKDDD